MTSWTIRWANALPGGVVGWTTVRYLLSLMCGMAPPDLTAALPLSPVQDQAVKRTQQTLGATRHMRQPG